MSVLIKDMPMPETCDDCPFHVYHSHHEYVCKATPMLYPMNLANSKGIRKNWCPLVKVKSHGRLIDADALIKALIRKEPFNDCARVVIAECMEEVRHAPTVIEAEDGT